MQRPIDWIIAGFRALSRGGPQAIKVEPIARAMKVSKGSFYWHFKDVNALKAAMLEHWETEATNAIIQEVESKANTPKEKLTLLIDISTDARSERYGGAQTEPSIREWARYDQKAADVLRRVDTKRLNYVTGLFDATGVSKETARRSANIIYAALVGSEHLAINNLGERRGDMASLLARLLKN